MVGIKAKFIFMLDCVMVIGNEKGYVYPYDIMTDPKRKKVTFDPQNEGGKRGAVKIDIVKYLPRSNMIAVLVGNAVQIVQSSGNDLKTIQTFTRKVHSFCVNNAVYKATTSTGETLTKDQICVATTDKQLYFYDMNINAGQFKFDEDTKRSHVIANRPVNMFWDDTLLYMATKKAYIIMNKDSGNILRSFAHDKLNFPVMTLSKTKCMILDTPSTAVYFDDSQGINKNVVFKIDPAKALSTIVL